MNILNTKHLGLSILFLFLFCLNLNAQKPRKIFNYLQENQLSLAVEEYSKISADKEYDNEDKVLFAYANCLFQIDTNYQKYSPIQSIKDFNNISDSSYTKESIDKFLEKYSLSPEIISERINREIHLQAKKINTVESYKNALDVCSSYYKDEFEKLIENKIKIELHSIKSLIDFHQLMNKYQNYIFQTNAIDSLSLSNKSFSYNSLIILSKQKVQEKYKEITLTTISNILYKDAVKSNEYELFMIFKLEFKTDNRISEINDKLKLIKFIEKSNIELDSLTYHIPFGFIEGLAPIVINNKLGYLDTTGKITIPCIYEYDLFERDSKYLLERHSPRNGFIRVQKKGEKGSAFINSKGKQITPFKYLGLSHFNKGISRVSIKDTVKIYSEDYCCKWKMGLIDTSGKEIASIIYDDIKDFDNGVAIVRINDNYGLINQYGKEIVPVKYSRISNFKENLATICANGRCGVINNLGEFILKPTIYEDIQQFNEGLAIVSLNGKCGIIDKKGIEILKPSIYDYIYGFKDGFSFIGSLNPQYRQIFQDGIINTSGKRLIRFNKYNFFTESESQFVNGLIEFHSDWKSDWKVGLLDTLGNQIMPLIYDDIEVIKGFIYAKKNNRWSLFNKLGKELNAYLCDDLSWYRKDNYVEIKIKDKYALINDSGRIISNYYSLIERLRNGFYVARTSNLNNYEDVYDFMENCRGVMLNKKGEEITNIDIAYKNITCEEFYNGVSWCRLDDKMILFDTNGVQLAKINTDLGYNFQYNFEKGVVSDFNIKTESGYRVGLINNKGEIIVTPKFTRIIYENGSHAIARDENNIYKILKILPNK